MKNIDKSQYTYTIRIIIKKKMTEEISNEFLSPFGDIEIVESDEEEVKEIPYTDYGFTSEELETAIKVLKCLAVDKELKLFNERRVKPLRQALIPLLGEMSSRFPVNPDKLARRKEAKAIKNARKQRQMRQDAQYIDASKLRAKRLLELQALQKGDDNGVRLLVPDGAVVEDVNINNTLNNIKNDNDDENLLIRPRSCYTCKVRYYKLHHFYDQLCPACATLSYEKRLQTADLRGKIALVTGGRVKIGFQIVLKLLRAGAQVIVTTRFPNDCARRFADLDDYDQFYDRISIFGLDFRYIPGVERFCGYLCNTLPRLDIIINNACQTIRRPPAYYKHLMNVERMPRDEMPKQWLPMLGTNPTQYINNGSTTTTTTTIDNSSTKKTSSIQASSSSLLGMKHNKEFGILSAPEMSQIPLMQEDNDTASFLTENLDVNQQQIDLRKHNSWLLKLEEVNTPELLECVSVNMMTPFIINSRLKKLMCKEICLHLNKFIVNVSAMEGKFYRYKTPNHPHTNMAKAAINMMTRTSSEDYAKSNIFMNSIDTGWINDENPLEKARKIFEESNFQTPIDEIDAASRVLDTVMTGVNMGIGLCPYGKFYKDFKESEW